MTINGQLKDQTLTYIQPIAEADADVGVAGNLLTTALTYDANVTTTTPLLSQMKAVDQIATFMDTNLLTITVFLGILST